MKTLAEAYNQGLDDAVKIVQELSRMFPGSEAQVVHLCDAILANKMPHQVWREPGSQDDGGWGWRDPEHDEELPAIAFPSRQE